ncbi:MAG: hypothetical protein WBA77_22020 [Microcoleaceae cyanobacterium]
MNLIGNNLPKFIITLLTTIILWTRAETIINAATLRGSFEISQFGNINPSNNNLVLGNFTGEDINNNGILSQAELSQFAADINIDDFSVIDGLSFDNILNFEL